MLQGASSIDHSCDSSPCINIYTNIFISVCWYMHVYVRVCTAKSRYSVSGVAILIVAALGFVADADTDDVNGGVASEVGVC
jgi:hypothetical protein